MDLFSSTPRKVYKHNPIKTVICQLRYPVILSIGVDAPNHFQDRIRDNFPDYQLAIEQQQQVSISPLISMDEKNIQSSILTVKNHCFLSADGKSKVNLTNNFIAYSTTDYYSWERFLEPLSLIFRAFLDEYHPAYFERIGLRYVDAINRTELNLQAVHWSSLISPLLLGVLSADDISEDKVLVNSYDSQIDLSDGYNLKLHSGLGELIDNPNMKQFIIDGDFYYARKVISNKDVTTDLAETIGIINNLHSHTGKLIRGCVLPPLESALGEDGR